MPRSTLDYRSLFPDFCKKVLDLSGVTPHLLMVGRSAAAADVIWRGGLYAAGYNFSTAEIIWRHYPSPAKILKRPAEFTAWVKANWKGLPLRKERKAVNAPARLAECILSFAQWSTGPKLSKLFANGISYDDAEANFQQVRFMGRYISIRFLEYLRQFGGLRPAMYDSRPNGGKYPRQGLALLYPEAAEYLNGGDSFAECAASNKIAIKELERLKTTGLYLNHYQLQSLICEFKQAALSGHQYPAKALDSELVYHARVAAYWGRAYEKTTQFYAVRTGFAPEARGELGGWPGKRKELDTVLRDYGYNWSDKEFSYKDTKDFGKPVPR